uniref:Helix-turn-helix domain protein n=1 Tax=Siphoviridae sp. ctTIi48 TaxID=2827875 RepID=A0A8S5TMK4_9CAUD|nr:MAG TPA: helix-turn-helix domain protein [Siphoviridae sp. ctTIi48]
MNIGQRIKNMRLKNNLTQDELALRINTTKQTIHKYENGIITNIPSSKIEAIANVLNTTPDYLMGWTEEASHKSSDYDNDTYSEILALLEAMPEQKRENAIEYLKFLSNQNDK